jgi:hypothetical protein
MHRKVGLVPLSLLGVIACSQASTPMKGELDAAAGGLGNGGSGTSIGGSVGGSAGGSPGTGGSTTLVGTSSMDGAVATGGILATVGSGSGGSTGIGTSAVGGIPSPASAGGSATGGVATVMGGTAATGGRTGAGGAAGNSAFGGTSSPSGGSATGGSALGGAGGTSTGGQTTTSSPANDSLGQNPFARPAASGILITSSDGLNSTELVLAADTKDGMFVAGATRNPQAMGLSAFDPGVVSEAFAARLDGQGKLVWSVPLKTCGVPADIAAGPDDTVFVLCPYEPDAKTLMPSTCDASASVEKLSGSDGKILFEARVTVPATAPTDAFLCPYGLGVDAQGRSYVGSGYTPSTQTTRVLLSAVTAAGQPDWALISDGPVGTPQTDSAVAYVNDVDVDSSGNVLFVGAFNTWMKLGTTQLTSQATTGQWSMYNGFYARIGSDGITPTAWSFGGTVFDLATSIAPTSNGGFVMGGWASATSNIGGKSVTASQDGSALVAQITAQGQAAWAKVIPGKSIADHVAVGPDGKVYVVGQFANDEILYTYDPSADALTSRKTTAGDATANGLRTHSVAVSTSGATWLTGTFNGTINLGTGALSTSSVGAFLIKMN